MNVPPTEFIRVPADALRGFAVTAFQQVGLNEDDAGLLARLLVENDLRGTWSHGTQQIPSYVSHFQRGELNPRPRVQVVSESPATLLLDGDGSLGYFAAYRAAHEVVDKTKAIGIAVAVTRNHGHFGAAGIYSRIPLAHNLIAYVTSGHQCNLLPDQPVSHAAGGSPMSFAIPCGEQPPLALDFGAMHDMYPGQTHRATLFDIAPGTFFRSVGLGVVCQMLGGLLTGIPATPERAQRAWSGANQGSLIIALDPARFLPVEDFVRETEDFMRRARAMQPEPGYDCADLPGGPEWRRAREYRAQGIPLGEYHQKLLAEVGEALGVAMPF